jgi:hypothetical protein
MFTKLFKNRTDATDEEVRELLARTDKKKAAA